MSCVLFAAVKSVVDQHTVMPQISDRNATVHCYTENRILGDVSGGDETSESRPVDGFVRANGRDDVSERSDTSKRGDFSNRGDLSGKGDSSERNDENQSCVVSDRGVVSNIAIVSKIDFASSERVDVREKCSVSETPGERCNTSEAGDRSDGTFCLKDLYDRPDPPSDVPLVGLPIKHMQTHACSKILANRKQRFDCSSPQTRDAVASILNSGEQSFDRTSVSLTALEHENNSLFKTTRTLPRISCGLPLPSPKHSTTHSSQQSTQAPQSLLAPSSPPSQPSSLIDSLEEHMASIHGCTMSSNTTGNIATPNGSTGRTYDSSTRTTVGLDTSPCNSVEPNQSLSLSLRQQVLTNAASHPYATENCKTSPLMSQPMVSFSSFLSPFSLISLFILSSPFAGSFCRHSLSFSIFSRCFSLSLALSLSLSLSIFLLIYIFL